ncbi:MAG: molecular chaperone HtpG, partial [Opitutus sp.]|nr:molecular chaperone HtpG [Opitutus sp.]
MSTATPQKFEFQAEIKQLLDIVVHSLYTEKEIFVRELVSNASDALEKLRHLQLTEKDIHDDAQALEIVISSDETAKTVTIQDFGLGMTRAELIENLGTIAHSGSKAFLQALGEGGAKNSNLIGQFGVGFYSAFMVAKSVKVYTHSWKKDEPGHVWTSDGSGSYEIEEAADQRRGAKIVIELKDECAEFAKEWRLKEILTRYSSFVGFPITLNGNKLTNVQALWLRSKAEIKDEEYAEFYKFIGHTSDTPRYRLHFSADAPLAINALLFVPQDNTEKLGFARLEPSVALYCRKVLIDQAPKDILPEWLRFLKGVVDSEDLPLNISRETMQDKALLDKLSKVITKRFLKLLEEESAQRADAYQEFYAQFGVFLKEGAALDFTHKDQLVKLLRFESSLTEPGKTTSLADYVSRMKDGQKEIYYLVAPNRAAIESGPYLEGFKARNLEVLFCHEAVDEYVFNNVREFDGKKFLSADHADVKLEDVPQTGEALSESDAKDLAKWLKDTLGEQVAEVKTSDRLVGSPALATNADKFASPMMRRMMKAMRKPGEADEPVKVNLEINPRH